MASDPCNPQEPFIKLGSGEAPTLDYNLPQKTCFSVYGRILQRINPKVFKKPVHAASEDNFWSRMAGLEPAKLLEDMGLRIQGGLGLDGYVRNAHLLKDATLATPTVARQVDLAGHDAADMVMATPAGLASNQAALRVGGRVDLRLIVRAISQGLMPVAERSFGGEPRLSFQKRPAAPRPRIVAVEEYRVCSFLGDYGAGKTVRTFTLLPGEKTTIAITSYEDREETSSRSENILDSFSQSAADEFEETLQNETGQDESESTTNTRSGGGGLSVSIPIKGVELGVDASAEAGRSRTVASQSYAKQISGAVERHVSKSSSLREVDVNVTSSESVASGKSTSVTRELQNINHSRVLNFVFRQLQQEYITLTFLRDVKFIFTNGYPGSTKVVELPELEEFLKTVVLPGKVDDALATLLKPYCQVYNHVDERFSFIERVEEDFGDCPFSEEGETISYWRKRKDLTDSYEGFEVPGPILDAKKTVLRTSSLVADALLGQGEALDCYNISLQGEAVEKAQLANASTQKALDTLDAISDPVERAEAHRTMLGEFCDGDSGGSSSDGS